MHGYRLLAVSTLVGALLAAAAGFAQQDDDDDDNKGKAAAPAAVTRASKDVPELILGSATDNFAVNRKDFSLTAGQGYRWKVTSAAGLEYKFVTELFRNVWMNQIVIDDLEVHMNGAPAWLEFDSAGTMQLQFTTVRPGTYTWSVPDLVDKGMKGTITIK